jgi:hypothetical protein
MAQFFFGGGKISFPGKLGKKPWYTSLLTIVRRICHCAGFMLKLYSINDIFISVKICNYIVFTIIIYLYFYNVSRYRSVTLKYLDKNVTAHQLVLDAHI